MIACFAVPLVLLEHAYGLTIYRFGGSDEAPAGADQLEVEFLRTTWEAARSREADAQTYNLEIQESLRPRYHDESRNLAQLTETFYLPGPTGASDPSLALDGNPETFWILDAYDCDQYAEPARSSLCSDGYSVRQRIIFDLGGAFLLRRIRILSGLASRLGVVEDLRLTIAPEILNQDFDSYATEEGTYRVPYWASPVVIPIRGNTLAEREVLLPAGQQRAVSLSVEVAAHSVPWAISEIEVYAHGVADSAGYLSEIIDLGAPSVVGGLHWSGHVASGADVVLQTRAGSDDDPAQYWRYTGRAGERVQVSRSQYAQLRVGERAGTSYDTDAWTLWSAPYSVSDSANVPLPADRPRRFFQFRVGFGSDGVSAARMDALEFWTLQPPLASRLVAEIGPGHTRVGERDHFTYTLRPTIRSSDRGFDTLELTTPSLLVALHDVRHAGVSVPFSEVARGDHHAVLRFPHLGALDSGALVEVDLEAVVLRTESPFEGRVSNSELPRGVSQRAEEGDATRELEWNRTSVLTLAQPKRFLRIDTRPVAVTPNGDGRNDTATIIYSLVELAGPASVVIGVHDLLGSLRRTLVDATMPLGVHTTTWDGRDDRGRLLPTGIYVLQARLRTQAGDRRETATICLVY